MHKLHIYKSDKLNHEQKSKYLSNLTNLISSSVTLSPPIPQNPLLTPASEHPAYCLQNSSPTSLLSTFLLLLSFLLQFSDPILQLPISLLQILYLLLQFPISLSISLLHIFYLLLKLPILLFQNLLPEIHILDLFLSIRVLFPNYIYFCYLLPHFYIPEFFPKSILRSFLPNFQHSTFSLSRV